MYTAGKPNANGHRFPSMTCNASKLHMSVTSNSTISLIYTDSSAEFSHTSDRSTPLRLEVVGQVNLLRIDRSSSESEMKATRRDYQSGRSKLVVQSPSR